MQKFLDSINWAIDNGELDYAKEVVKKKTSILRVLHKQYMSPTGLPISSQE
jgi:hypothetical protein